MPYTEADLEMYLASLGGYKPRSSPLTASPAPACDPGEKPLGESADMLQTDSTEEAWNIAINLRSRGMPLSVARKLATDALR